MPEYLHKCLGKLGYTVLIKELSKEEVKKAKDDCTVTTTVLPAYKDFQKPQKYILYWLDRARTTLFLPRYYGLDTFGVPDYVALSEGRAIRVKCAYEPLKHQAAAIEKLKARYTDTGRNQELGNGGVLSLPCGYGKTFCAIWTACQLGLTTLIIVPTECLMDQWMDAIHEFAPGAKVGWIQQDRVEVEGCDFVVAMIHSICLKDYSVQLFDRFGLTVFDECHHLGSKMFCKAMMKIRTKYTLGLSATPNRRDGLSNVFYKFLGPLFHKEKRSGTNKVIIKKIHLYSNSENYQILRMANGIKNTSGMITAVSKLEERNQLLVYILKQLIYQGRKILLISSRRQHLHDLRDMLDAEAIRHHDTGKFVTYGFYYGKQGMNRKKHKALLAESAKCDIVLGIDTIAKEGLDIPDRNTLVWATSPGIDVEQPVGRILRKYHKDVNPLVIDFVDHTGNFPNHSRERDKWFREEEYIIQEHTVELLGNPMLWQDKLLVYLNKKKVLIPIIKKIEEKEPPSEPDGGVCLLAMDSDYEPKQHTKTKPIAKVKAIKKLTKGQTRVVYTRKKDEPDPNGCLLSDTSGRNNEKAVKKRQGPDLDVCLL